MRGVRIEPADGSLAVVMPAPRALAQALIAVSWLPFLAAALVALFVAVQTFCSLVAQHGGGGVASGAFFVAFALFLTAVCLAGLAGALYGLLGSEVARVEDGGLTLERVLFGAKVRQHYAEARKLRLAKPAEERRSWTAPAPTLLFESEGHTHGFGAGLTPDEAREVLAAVREALGD